MAVALDRVNPTVVWVGRFALVGLFLWAWEFGSNNLLDPFWLSSPSRIGVRLAELLQSGELLRHTLATLNSFAAGFFLGALSGVAAGLVMARLPRLLDAVHPYLTAVYSLPKVALAPLLIFWFGIGIESKIALVWFITFFLVFWNAMAGIRAIRVELIDTLRIMGASPLQMVTKLEVPSIVSWIMTSLKIALPLALHGAIAGELFGANRGLGFLISYAAARLDTTGVISVIIVVVCISGLLNALLNVVQQRLDRWRL